MDVLELQEKALEELGAVNDLAGLEAWRVKFLGRKSELSRFLRSLEAKPLSERKRLGELGNQLRRELEHQHKLKRESLAALAAPFESFDITRPGKKHSRGHLHPITQVIRRATEIFGAMGFAVVEGPEIELERNNFDSLNIPVWHPARDMMDTFWIKPRNDAERYAERRGKIPRKSASSLRSSALLLRTHTSPVQIRYMQNHQPPFRIIAPGRVYRHEATDARHEMQFHQIEGLMVGDNVSLANLKAVVEMFIISFFGPAAKLRMRPGYFPFVEPGVEFDLSCIGCQTLSNSSRILSFKSRTNAFGQDSRSVFEKDPRNSHSGRIREVYLRRIREVCRLCGGSGWLEFAGAGMVHPNVFRAVGYNPAKVQGFAFGMGVERLAMIKYKIDDIRLFHSGDLRFINQF